MNKKQKPLSIKELMDCRGFENYTAKQKKETIKTLEKLSILFYERHQKSRLEKERKTIQTIEKIE